MKLFAVRNLRLCTKDCLCLYVCPTGASDTEDSIIDVKTCIGCGTCAAACPGGAISMVPYDYPPQQKKARAVLDHAASHPSAVYVCTEVGCGVVPVDRFQREWREAVGRVCCALAREAGRVDRVWCGLAVELKGEEG